MKVHAERASPSTAISRAKVQEKKRGILDVGKGNYGRLASKNEGGTFFEEGSQSTRQRSVSKYREKEVTGRKGKAPLQICSE